MNLPKEELESVERICFQVEEAQWFYEDFVRPLDPHLPSLNLRQFCLRIFQHCPLLSGFSPYHHSTAFSEFLAYKTRVPVRGAIMLNEAMDEVVLVKGWKKNANWSFPRGKINKDEKDLHCAIREVYEETGFDIKSADLVPDEQNVTYIEVTMREQHMRLYIFRGVPMDTDFEPRTRKEISKIQWYKLSELPTLKKMKQQQQDGQGGDMTFNANKFYMVAPFLSPLKKWISQQKKLETLNSQNRNKVSSVLRDSKLKEDQNLFSDVPTNPAKSDDMNRLMTQLRQSGQAGPTGNLIELSGSTEGPNDASIPLKTLLNVPSASMGITPNMERHDFARDEKANAMLSLLRSGAPQVGSQKVDKSVELPQTPFEQILEFPRMPPSPKNETTRGNQLPMVALPPAFPFSPNHVASQRPQQPHVNTSNSTQIPARSIGTLHEQTKTAPLQSYTLPPSTIPQQNHHALAPYQRTGDPQFAHGSQTPQHLPPSIPPANALPPPKLTSHSSVLLDIFRSGSLAKPSVQTKPSPASDSAEASLPHGQNSSKPILKDTQTQAPVQQVLNIQSRPDMAPSIPLVPTQQALAEAMYPRSHQQEALLNIFRTVSSPAAQKPHTSSPSLAPPTTLVELSAQPSPSHSRVSSEVKKEMTSLPFRNGHVRIQRRPEPVRKASQGPLTATVTGPLNFPQFDKIVKPPEKKATNVPNSSAKAYDDVSTTNQRYLTILPRPLAQMSPIRDQLITNSETTGPAPKEEIKAVAHTARTAVKKDSSPKPFHPQILRRPIRAEPISVHPIFPPSASSSSTIANIPAASPYQSSPLVTKDNFFLDRRSSQTQEQKTALLSLFSKPNITPSAMLPPPTPTRVPTVSPVSEKPTRINTAVPSRSSSILPSPLDIARSRVGSWNSFVVDGDKSVVLGPASGRQTPKPSPVDKKFLLGFLDGVVREGAK